MEVGERRVHVGEKQLISGTAFAPRPQAAMCLAADGSDENWIAKSASITV